MFRHLLSGCRLVPCTIAFRSAWISSGIMAALVDCAAGLTSCEPQQQLNNNQLNTSGCCSRLQAVIQGLADCVHVVLEHAGDQACQQAQLLVSCVAKSLCDSSTADASMVAALLTTVLKGITGSIKSESMWDPLRQVGSQQASTPCWLNQCSFSYCLVTTRFSCEVAQHSPDSSQGGYLGSSAGLFCLLWVQACQDPLLLQQILWCYSRATAYHQAMLNTQSTAMQLSGPQSTQQRLELPSGKIFDLFPSSDSARTGWCFQAAAPVMCLGCHMRRCYRDMAWAYVIAFSVGTSANSPHGCII